MDPTRAWEAQALLYVAAIATRGMIAETEAHVDPMAVGSGRSVSDFFQKAKQRWEHAPLQMAGAEIQKEQDRAMVAEARAATLQANLTRLSRRHE